MNNSIKISLLCFYTIATFATTPTQTFNIKDVILNNKITRKIHNLINNSVFFKDSDNNLQYYLNDIYNKLKQNGTVTVSKEDTLECLDSLDGMSYNEDQMFIKILECHVVILPNSESTNSDESTDKNSTPNLN